ncbi:protein-tyrosine phosphatase family protein [Yoonia sp.]|uniref:protein-tyrosine phosphatase family protein n=1 Tax=Yoonia sp. TaxID=2212373 RepID=UPI002FDB6B58
MDGFAIYDIPAGGGTLAIAPMPGRTRHYYTDWLHLMDWRPDLVISLTLQHELMRKGAGTLGSDLENERIGWLHLPIPDMDIPPNDIWPEARHKALKTLASGGKVLVHCFGGCGRSGMLCLRLMIAAGEPPEAALDRLRKARPCAVETEAQMDWALQG